MAPIPQSVVQPTVSAIYAAYERNADTQNRPHLGASLIGRECSRALWYTFRWSGTQKHPGRLLRLFERGQREEDVFNANLRAAGVTVLEVDPQTGQQWNFKAIGGHFGLSLDGVALGILEAPKTWHSLEYKTSSNKLFQKLAKEGVEKAKPEHFAQMQIGMHLAELTRAFYLVVNKDNDELYSERVKYNKDIGDSLLSKAARIITAPEPTERISERPDWFQCQYCDHRAICHNDAAAPAIPAVNCRTCAHATPELDGDARWSCASYGIDISTEAQRRGSECPAHVFIPALLPWSAVDADEAEGWVEYQTPDGRTVRNGPGGYASREIAAGAGICGDAVVDRARETMGAEVVG